MAQSLSVPSKSRCIVALSPIVLLLLADGAHGDQQLADDKLGDLSSRETLEEIIVSAQKRDKPLQQIAASVSVFSRDFAVMAGIDNVADLGLFTPNMVVSTNGTAGRVYIRGIGNNLDFLGSQGAVAVHVDGVYQSRQWGVFYDLMDVERIEVLRGPQGTLYGRNATGGVINILSSQPTAEFSSSATLTLGNFDQVGIKGAVSSELGDGVLARFAIMGKKRDGFTENLFPGSANPDDEELISANAEIHLSPNDSVELRVLGRFFSRDAAGRAIVPTVDGLAATFGARSNADPFVVSHNTDIFFEADSYGLTAIATWQLAGNFAVHSITGYGENAVDYHLDTDGTEVDAIHFRNSEDHSQFSQEVRLLSPVNDGRWTWQAGLYYLREDTDDSGTVFVPAFGIDVPVSGEIDVEAYAAYAQGTYSLNSQLGLTLGLRYNGERKKMASQDFGDDRASWTNWTPHLSLEYEMGADAFAYASITKGFKSGGYNTLVDGTKFGPENVWSFEIGTKTRWRHSNARINTAAFYSKYDDQQVNTFTGAGLARIDNAAESTIFGLELEALVSPTEGAELGVTLAYLDATFDQYVAADPFLGGVDLSGARLSHAPKYSFTFFGEYSYSLRSQSDITAYVDFRWQSETKFDVFDNPSTNQSSFGIGNAGIWYSAAERQWRIGAWIRNLADKAYFISHVKLNFTPDGVISMTGEPRTYGVELRFEF